MSAWHGFPDFDHVVVSEETAELVEKLRARSRWLQHQLAMVPTWQKELARVTAILEACENAASPSDREKP